jgi:hypothetical protein
MPGGRAYMQPMLLRSPIAKMHLFDNIGRVCSVQYEKLLSRCSNALLPPVQLRVDLQTA